MYINIYKRDEPLRTKGSIGTDSISVSDVEESFDTFYDYFTWALGRAPDHCDRYKFCIEHSEFSETVGPLDAISFVYIMNKSTDMIEEVYRNCYVRFQEVQDYNEHERNQYDLLSVDAQLVDDIEQHVWSDSLDDDTKKEYAARIIKVMSKLL